MTKRLKNLIVGVVIGVILIAAGLITGIILINNANKNAPTYVSTAAELEKAVNDDIDKPIVLKDNIIINGDFTANKLFDLEMNNHNVTVDGKFTLKTEESGEMYLCDGKNSLFTREVIKAKQIEVDAVNATVVWNANVTLKDGYTADDFKITVSQHTFIFNGIILNEEGTQSPTAMTVAGGRVVVADNSDEGAASEGTIVVPNTANSVVIENHGANAVSVYAGTGVSVAGKVEVSVADEAEGVVISTPENNEIPTNIVIVSGTAESVNADGAEVTVGENAVVTGTVTGDKVTNNGSVGEIVADEIIDNSLTEYKTAKKAEIEQYALDKGESNYSAQNWALIEGYVSAAKTAIDAAEDKAAVDSAVSSAKASIDEVITSAEEAAEALKAKKTEAKSALDEYVSEEDYYSEEWAEITALIASGKEAIDAAGNITAVETALTAAKAEIDKIATKSEADAAALKAKKTEAKSALDKYVSEEDYYSEEWAEITALIASGKEAIDAAGSITAVDTALTAAKTEIDKVATKAKADEAARQAALADLNNFVATINEEEYTAEDFDLMEEKIATAREALSTATKETADGIVASLKAELGAIEVAPVRVEGGVGYATFEEALAVVQTGDVIILQGNIATEGKVTTLRADSRDLDFTLDLNGFAITDRLDLRSTTVDNKESGYKLKVTVKNGTVGAADESVYYGILLAGGNVDVTLYEVESLGYYGGIYENGSWSGSSVTAEKCTFKGSDTAFGAYLPGGHTSTFTDCTFEGTVGVYVKSGNKTFNNCKITGNGEYIAPSYNNNGADGSGSGLVVDSTVGYNQPMTVTVNGGTISSVNGYAVEEVSNAAAGVDKVCYSTVTLDNVSLSGKIENVYSENGVVKSIEGDKTVNYVSSETAINNVAPYVGDGEYIVLTGDIVSTNESNNLLLHSAYDAKNYTLDLNGHRLNAEVYAMASHSKGDYETLNITIMDSSAEEGKPGKGLIGSDVENMYGIIPQGNSNMTVTLKNLNVTGEWAFYTNGIYSGATITAEDCVFVTNPLDPGFGAYLASNHNVTFTNCTFEGNAGVYIKSGNTTFNSCIIAGNGVYEKPSYNNNGADGSGSGLVVDSTVGYQSPMVVTVNGGTISSVNGYAVEEVSNAAEGVDKVCYSEVTVQGAELSGALGDVYSENGVVTVIDENNAKSVYVGSAAGFENLIKNPTKGMTIVLCDDISGDKTDYTIKNTKNLTLTLDLNEHRLEGELVVKNTTTGLNPLTVTIKNGTVGSQTGYTAAGGMIWYGLMLEGSGKMTITLQNVDFVGYYGGYYENGSYGNPSTVITATDCTFKASINEEDKYTGYGAYIPAKYSSTFTRCTFEGSVGVYVKSGTRTFTDCTINGVYDKYVVPTYNGNGANGAGSGLIVNSTKGYSKPMVITVTGGSISSASGYAVEELALAAEGESTECYATVSIKNAELSGALGDVYSENGVVTVLCECGVQCVRQLTTLPTATKVGVQQYVCPDCGKVYGGKSVAALPEGGIYASVDGGDFFEIGFVTDLESDRYGDSDIILGLQGKQTLTIYNVLYTDAETLLNEGFEFNSAWFEINEGERVMNDDYTYVYDNTVRVDLLEGAANKGASANKAITINLADYPDLSFITYFYDVAKDGGSYLSMGYIEIDMTSSVNVIAAV